MKMWLFLCCLSFALLPQSSSFQFRLQSTPTKTSFPSRPLQQYDSLYQRNKISKPALYSNRCDRFAEFLARGKRWGGPILGPIIRHINTIFIGLIFGFMLRIRNTFKSYRENILFDRIWNRPAQQGLLTVSNHKSFYDDPGLWAALLPWWRVLPHRLRWSLCTEDVFFSVSVNRMYIFRFNNIM